MPRPSLAATLALLAATLLAPGCAEEADVVLYCAVDKEHSEPIVRAFEAATGLKVDFHPDVEASKSVGHRRRIMEERNNPRCDVFWNNEVVQMAMLAENGLLQPYVSPAAADIPAGFKDADGLWAGFGARARVLIVNTEAFPDPADYPDATSDLLDPRYAGRCGLAKPLTGTTAAHGSAWIAEQGLDDTLSFFDALRANDVRFVASNGTLMRLVREGELDFGFTDTDDVKAAMDQGFSVARVVPDQGAGEPGVLIIPNAVGMVAGAPHEGAARQLIDYLLSHEVERLLAHGPSAQIPVRDAVERPDDVLDLSEYKVMSVDWAAVGRAYADHAGDLEAYFNQ